MATERPSALTTLCSEDFPVDGVLMAHIEWLPGVMYKPFSTTCAVYIEDCWGWRLPGVRSSVVEHGWIKQGALGLIPGRYQPFHFPSNCGLVPLPFVGSSPFPLWARPPFPLWARPPFPLFHFIPSNMLVLCPDPTQLTARRRGPVSQVQILGSIEAL